MKKPKDEFIYRWIGGLRSRQNETINVLQLQYKPLNVISKMYSY